MSWTVALNPAGTYVDICFCGMVPPEELALAGAESLRVGTEAKCRALLADCTAMEGGHTLTDLYRLIDELVESGVSQKFKEAVLMPKAAAAAGAAQFWETACVNRWMEVRLFEDRALALAWLLV